MAHSSQQQRSARARRSERELRAQFVPPVRDQIRFPNEILVIAGHKYIPTADVIRGLLFSPTSRASFPVLSLFSTLTAHHPLGREGGSVLRWRGGARGASRRAPRGRPAAAAAATARRWWRGAAPRTVSSAACRPCRTCSRKRRCLEGPHDDSLMTERTCTPVRGAQGTGLARHAHNEHVRVT